MELGNALIGLILAVAGYFLFNKIAYNAKNKTLEKFYKKIAELEIEKQRADAQIKASQDKIEADKKELDKELTDVKEKNLEDIKNDLNDRYNRE